MVDLAPAPAEVCVLGLLVGMFGIVLLVLGTQAHDLFPGGPARCAGGRRVSTPRPARPPSAGSTRSTGTSRTSWRCSTWSPFVIGAFLGAPLLARELEDGTWQLAWTQAVPRMRWLAAKLAALAGVTVALTGDVHRGAHLVPSAVRRWEGRFQYDAFDLEGLVPVAYALFAFGARHRRRGDPAAQPARSRGCFARLRRGTSRRGKRPAPRYQAPQTLVATAFRGNQRLAS